MALPDVKFGLPSPNRCSPARLGAGPRNKTLQSKCPWPLREEIQASLAAGPVGPPGRRAPYKIKYLPKLSLFLGYLAAGINRLFPEEIPYICLSLNGALDLDSAGPSLMVGSQRACCPQQSPNRKSSQMASEACSKRLQIRESRRSPPSRPCRVSQAGGSKVRKPECRSSRALLSPVESGTSLGDRP